MTWNTYESWDEYLGDKPKRTIKRSWMPTWAERMGDDVIAIGLNETYIMFFRPDNTVELRTDGWKTVTTKDRMNDYLPQGWHVYQEKREWYVRNWRTDEVWPFAEGITIDYANETVHGEADPELEDERRLRDKRIKKYAKGFAEALAKSELRWGGAGDCWMCVGMFGDEAQVATDHLESHFEEKYYVGALLKNAVAFKPVSMMAETGLAYSYAGEEIPAFLALNIMKEQVTKSLVAYLRHCFNKAEAG